MGEGLGDYTEFQIDGRSVAGGMPMAPPSRLARRLESQGGLAGK
jgi:hypothetical protein